jgi:hypothetical protein
MTWVRRMYVRQLFGVVCIFRPHLALLGLSLATSIGLQPTTAFRALAGFGAADICWRHE